MRAGPPPSVEERGNYIMKLNFQAEGRSKKSTTAKNLSFFFRLGVSRIRQVLLQRELFVSFFGVQVGHSILPSPIDCLSLNLKRLGI